MEVRVEGSRDLLSDNDLPWVSVTMRKGCPLILKKAKKSGMDEDMAMYVDIEQMVKRDLRDAEMPGFM